MQMEEKILLGYVTLVEIGDTTHLLEVRVELGAGAGHLFRLIESLDFAQVLVKLKKSGTVLRHRFLLVSMDRCWIEMLSCKRLCACIGA